MKENLRQVGKNLWVSDRESAALVQDSFALILDCEGDGACENAVQVAPTGKTNHTWEAHDLERIIKLALPVLETQQDVLIHCRHGRSRSACAAAAVLIARQEAHDLEEALAKTRAAEKIPAVVTVASLRRWYHGIKQPSLVSYADL